ncbi:4Fe-4S binding protein [Acidiluteibacter ferrifornacis]|uniref:4Fe-4S binding protein n=1 Tax=Acidiluteibacter ferrifornacis TaxID=2692424 RepID=A0A6N9NG55_9FLAO|nr:4Fe-4S binding protein [Acidiluteibacter ferrifornacis]NBG64809.1 4Fe-4S binding protein [Acidiluteibacter ferrifornacis]
MKIIQRIGLFLFAIGFIAFIGSLFISSYTLTQETIINNAQSKAQATILTEVLAEVVNHNYTSKWAFVSAINNEIETLNTAYRENQEWDKVIYNQKELLFYFTKNSTVGPIKSKGTLWFLLTFGVGILGAVLTNLFSYIGHAGIKNNGIFFSKWKSRGWIGMILGGFLILFYILLYWFPMYIAEWALMLDPLSKSLSGNPASQWFLYGFLYTVAIITMGIRFIKKYRHNKYQVVRTISVMFFQTSFAFIIPDILARLNLPAYDLKNIFPLDYTLFFEWRLDEYLANGFIGYFMLFWSISLFLIGVPLITYFYGKRWYCSWVCGCGGLAETAGDEFRHLSDKSLKAWRLERFTIHTVLVFAIFMTVAVIYAYITGDNHFLGMDTYKIREWYGFAIGSVFAGVVGTGFYPILGNRAWCRFGCPLAAYLGLVQRFKSRFRITTNGGQCISCGNCSTYCEMGIDVKWYAQRGQNIVRSSCVGCGICSAVCPRGVLKLENGAEEGRFNDESIFTFGNDGVRLRDDL